MSILHVSGFRPFAVVRGKEIPNPSDRTVEYLNNTPGLKEHLAELAGVDEVRTYLSSVPKELTFEAFRRACRKKVNRILEAVGPNDRLIMLGQGIYSQRGRRVERRFANTLKHADLGQGPINPDRPMAHTLGQGERLRPLVKALQAKHPNTSESDDSGLFACNFFGYSAEDAIQGRSLFIHQEGCADQETATHIWNGNRDFYKAKGIMSPEEMSCPTAEERQAFLESIATIWRPSLR